MTPYLEIGGDRREVVPDVWLVELPLPYSLGLVNVYLVRLERGWLLVDCGMDTPACFGALDRARAGLQIPWREISMILPTHIHPDHAGLAPRLLETTGARLALHEADRAHLAAMADHERFQAWEAGVLKQAGVSAEMVEAIGAALGEIHRTFRALEPDWRLAGGETLPGAHGPLEIVWTPGHSPGHVCVYDRARRALLSGDHMLEHISPNIGWQPGRDALGEFLASLDRIGEMEVDLVLPSHGAPFTGHRAWVARAREHHRERCRRILALLGDGPRSADELVRAMWDGLSSPFHYRFAVFEVLAHLEYLRRRGEV